MIWKVDSHLHVTNFNLPISNPISLSLSLVKTLFGTYLNLDPPSLFLLLPPFPLYPSVFPPLFPFIFSLAVAILSFLSITFLFFTLHCPTFLSLSLSLSLSLFLSFIIPLSPHPSISFLLLPLTNFLYLSTTFPLSYPFLSLWFHFYL